MIRFKTAALLLIAVLAFAFVFTGCGGSFGAPDPDRIVPARETLIQNLKAKGYEIEELTKVKGSELAVDRVIAKNGDRFIDIAYGLSSEEAEEIFGLYRGMYPDDYYILARNGNYVYCVSDKSTFKKADFSSTENIGTQYIHG